MKHLFVHYKNKYPNGHVDYSEEKLDAYCDSGIHRVALRKGGGGQLLDQSKELGAVDKHDLAPIPKNARAWKLHADGSVGQSEEFLARQKFAKILARETDGKILSIEEYKAAGLKVDKEGNVELPEPVKAAPQEPLVVVPPEA